MDQIEELDAHEALRVNLEFAQECAQKALDGLYVLGGPKRSLLYRMLLGRAQSILMGLYKQELGRKNDGPIRGL